MNRRTFYGGRRSAGNGYGLRYTVEVGGRARHLWRDEGGWYVERIVHDGVASM